MNTGLLLAGVGAFALLALRNKPKPPAGKVSTTSGASQPNQLSDWLTKVVPQTKVTPDQSQTINAIGGIFGDILKGLTSSSSRSNKGSGIGVSGGGGGGSVAPRRNSPQAVAQDNASYDNLNTSPVDIYGNEVSSYDLGPTDSGGVPNGTSYDLGPYDNFGFDATDPFANYDFGSFDFSSDSSGDFGGY